MNTKKKLFLTFLSALLNDYFKGKNLKLTMRERRGSKLPQITKSTANYIKFLRFRSAGTHIILYIN